MWIRPDFFLSSASFFRHEDTLEILDLSWIPAGSKCNVSYIRGTWGQREPPTNVVPDFKRVAMLFLYRKGESNRQKRRMRGVRAKQRKEERGKPRLHISNSNPITQNCPPGVLYKILRNLRMYVQQISTPLRSIVGNMYIFFPHSLSFFVLSNLHYFSRHTGGWSLHLSLLHISFHSRCYCRSKFLFFYVFFSCFPFIHRLFSSSGIFSTALREISHQTTTQ